jgi:hypothetical protein
MSSYVSINRRARLGSSRAPLNITTRSDGTGFRARTASGRSTMRASMTGTTMNASARYRDAWATAASASKRRWVSIVPPRAMVSISWPSPNP